MEGEIIVNGNFYYLTKHAIHRANKREITLDEIIEVLEAPKRKRRMKKSGKSDSIAWVGRNKVVLILDAKESTVITLMRRSKAYSKGRAKERKNKSKLYLKRSLGNRYREK